MVKLPKAVVEAGVSRWQNALVGQLIGIRIDEGRNKVDNRLILKEKGAPTVSKQVSLPKNVTEVSNMFSVLEGRGVAKWKGGVDRTCVFYHGAVESRDHLYFDWAFSTSVWKTVLQMLGERRNPRYRSFELQWASIKYKGKSLRAAIARLAWHACIYHIWKAGNGNIFEGIALSESKVVGCIKQDVKCRLMGVKGLHQKVRNDQQRQLLDYWGLSLTVFSCF
ncbi:hypothetical protein CRG98_009714 [Punica granatum]|uniref:Reverse transcriptase zinc-binding domain-containing protein n=1 Tax=Punica granatum TaxID=22663 RepID=A0A2I0KN17_PUNGR|nr:hypothetical protein CRG98_009714 [Punica granatum]